MTYPNSPLSADDRTRMRALTANLPTKSAKIRALSAGGYKRAEIATFLGLRYQHVRNVLLQKVTRPLGMAATAEAPYAPTPAEPTRVSDAALSQSLDPSAGAEGIAVVEPDGSLRLPVDAMASIGAAPGKNVVWLVADGEVRVLGFKAAVRRIRQDLAELGGPTSINDELFAERRRDFAREEADRAGDEARARAAAKP